MHHSGLAATAMAMSNGGLASLRGQTAPHHMPPVTRPALDPNTLAKFVDPLPIPAIARPDENRASPSDPAVKVPYYRIAMREIETKVASRPESDSPVGTLDPRPARSSKLAKAKECWLNG